MTNIAEKTIIKHRALFLKELSSLNGFIANEDNQEIVTILEEDSVYTKDIGEQETFIMGDGSYITRLDDEYWVGGDVDLFEVEMTLSDA